MPEERRFHFHRGGSLKSRQEMINDVLAVADRFLSSKGMLLTTEPYNLVRPWLLDIAKCLLFAWPVSARGRHLIRAIITWWHSRVLSTELYRNEIRSSGYTADRHTFSVQSTRKCF